MAQGGTHSISNGKSASVELFKVEPTWPENALCVQVQPLLLTSDVCDRRNCRTRSPYFGLGFAAT